MNNDLISRLELKKAFEEVYPLSTNEMGGVINKRIYEIIDNAPTVFSCNACKNMGNERECVDCHDYSNYVHYEERPQGAWIGNAFDEHHCNRCGHPALWEEEPDDYYESQSNFCPNCGADMRGGAE